MSRQQRENPESKPLVAGAVKVLFEVIKHFLHDFEINRTAKKFERYSEQFQTLENMLLKADKRIQECRKEIEDLKQRLLWSNVLLVAILILLIVQIAIG
jgi:hypothetical protein